MEWDSFRCICNHSFHASTVKYSNGVWDGFCDGRIFQKVGFRVNSKNKSWSENLEA